MTIRRHRSGQRLALWRSSVAVKSRPSGVRSPVAVGERGETASLVNVIVLALPPGVSALRCRPASGLRFAEGVEQAQYRSAMKGTSYGSGMTCAACKAEATGAAPSPIELLELVPHPTTEMSGSLK